MKERAPRQANREPVAPVFFGGHVKSLWVLLLAGLVVLSGCGGGSTSNPPPNSVSLTGNWQFTMASPSDNSFTGGMQGGFLVQNKSSVTGAVVYSILLPATQTVCSGSGPVTGTLSGQNVTLTVTAGTQTFSLTGTLSTDGSTMVGTYTSIDGKDCGTAQTGLQWTATSVPPLTGTIQGNFHSVTSGSAHLSDQDFAVSGLLTQGNNIGASNATVTGTLNFQGYPCLDTASVNGQISGTSVILQLVGIDGLTAGQIGAPAGSTNPSPVSFDSSAQGFVLHGMTGYGISTKACPGGNVPGDVGNVCLALGNSTSCTQPISLSPASISFPAQALGSVPTSQSITLTNSDPSGSTLTGLSLSFQPGNASVFGLSDFNGLPNFTEQDSCAPSPGSTFSLGPLQTCSITVSFSPQESCPWLPSVSLGGVPPSQCPAPLTAKLTVTSPTSADGDPAFAVPITGLGLSALVPSTPELDFGAEALGEASLPQSLSFTNQSKFPVQILASLPCLNPKTGVLKLPRPLAPGTVAGLQVVTGIITPDGSTIDYLCDSDPTSTQPNFRISADTCSASLLAPQDSCSFQVAFVPQPATPSNPALDYFLELNTLQCTSSTTTDCEIDSGRFPVELRANTPSPLRMSPGAGLDFGTQAVGKASAPLTITLFNDPNDPNAGTVNFTGNLVKGDYAESDDCGPSLAPGGSCTLSITFKPKIVGLDPGTITITYTPLQTQTVYMRGAGQ